MYDFEAYHSSMHVVWRKEADSSSQLVCCQLVRLYLTPISCVTSSTSHTHNPRPMQSARRLHTQQQPLPDHLRDVACHCQIQGILMTSMPSKRQCRGRRRQMNHGATQPWCGQPAEFSAHSAQVPNALHCFAAHRCMVVRLAALQADQVSLKLVGLPPHMHNVQDHHW
ncbi:hypothetical protein COO60DRAFT_519532 [Scenedesmus sp. NREL 46B-D3]|nr:hypothetical protein COO60DRAFT_519532 [Scenedesmus sp. NREL 46B-D3]